jgi:hypothetical protein
VLGVHVRDQPALLARAQSVFFDGILQRVVHQRDVGVRLLQPRDLPLQVLQAFEVAGGQAAVLGLSVVQADVQSPVAPLMPISRQRPGTFSPRSLRPKTEMILASLNRDLFTDRR